MMRSKKIISNWYEVQRNLFTLVVRDPILANLRPRSSEQNLTAINEFKNSLSQKIKALLNKAPDQVKKYKRFLFWCSDETRLGLHTIQRRRITLRGVKPVGKHQWKFKCFWLYGAVYPSTGRSFFGEFSHLDKVCFQAYLEQLSLEYPDELHIIQVDNAPGHLLSTSELPDNIILLFQPPHCLSSKSNRKSVGIHQRILSES
ncbi:MAG: hypothetical protein JGK30_24555 [Microcoleus sp. PH2017_40_RAT_O_B]|nr:hypothetical protein [Microcoleus sp. PH2017_05_CCC_O_A]MCC3475946.1 hypothetical protein [Microcoleus sp. PH2017_13_LAR_U_A]MCC3491783.1 hypothetical protein [Microcoleus sp. PH2017_16_JOR_D_A]MCC3568409.1 hypothetical protein [Microcoleus sp. PH2017_31_RDM_U_A]MCC3574942.1 hypothetical protein [Microcoleus sp. PH2017_34_RAT_O_A]MCC3579333.1 hypothetical protein [Microcoleus sp. PH2017_32_RDM_D_A]MCC3612562.1 hypothetical protein [Microcoleus sp. PH2017_40_RAT_O_B]